MSTPNRHRMSRGLLRLGRAGFACGLVGLGIADLVGAALSRESGGLLEDHPEERARIEQAAASFTK